MLDINDSIAVLSCLFSLMMTESLLNVPANVRLRISIEDANVEERRCRTENRILGALARLDDFLKNPLIQGHSGTAPETFRNTFSTGQGTNEDDSQSDPHPEAGIFHNQTTQNSGPEEGHDNCYLMPSS